MHGLRLEIDAWGELHKRIQQNGVGGGGGTISVKERGGTWQGVHGAQTSRICVSLARGDAAARLPEVPVPRTEGFRYPLNLCRVKRERKCVCIYAAD